MKLSSKTGRGYKIERGRLPGYMLAGSGVVQPSGYGVGFLRLLRIVKIHSSILGEAQ